MKIRLNKIKGLASLGTYQGEKERLLLEQRWTKGIKKKKTTKQLFLLFRMKTNFPSNNSGCAPKLWRKIGKTKVQERQINERTNVRLHFSC